MIALSIALVIVSIFASQVANSWIAFQRRKHEDGLCRVVTAEDAAKMRSDLDAMRAQVNGLAMQRGLTNR